ncbi:MAG: maleylpyruvate isomerase family mycothiol-dependent enzyme [Intrasporangium sp.]|uniref:maleylpyruvate isomerase family mycothiol-dependent enzyme n=1 Tax=Intrasporangium sp. TaxID=1925024 RepID=UPI003F808CE5
MPQSSHRGDGSLPFVDHLHHESVRFRSVLAEADDGLHVPTCPDWSTDDLLWHLAEVQWFWGEIAERRVTDRAELAGVEAAKPQRPRDRAGLLDLFDRSSERLVRQLTEAPPETELWMWADDHSAAYIARRQAHEALVHRIDAELTAGAERAPVDCRLAADGVDEALRIMRGFEPEPGFSAAPTGAPVTIALVDGFHTWTVTPVHVTGTDTDGDTWDVHRFLVLDGPAEAAAEICGAAADIDCWLWDRPPAGEIARIGDEQAVARVEAVVTGAID